MSAFRSTIRKFTLPNIRSMRFVCSLVCWLLLPGTSLFAQEPAKFLVAKEEASVYAGREVVGTLTPGQRVEVRQIKEDWVGILKPVSGWVSASQLIEPGAALEHFNARLKENPQDERALLARAKIWLERSEQQRGLAIRAWSETIQTDSQHASAFFHRAKIWRSMNKLERAITDLDMSIKLDPFQVAAYEELADVLLEQGDHRRAVAAYTEVIRLRPWQAKPQADRGWAQYLAGNRTAALEDLEIARRLNPQDAKTWYRLGLLYSVDKYSHRATECLDQAIQLNPRMAEAYFVRAPRHSGFEATEKSLKDYNTAIHLNPQYQAAYQARGMFCLELGQYDHAIRDLSHVIELNPHQESAFLERGKMYLDRAQGELALKDLKRAADLNPELLSTESEVFVKAYHRRALQRLSNKEYGLAAEDYTAALAVAPEDLDLVAERGQCYLLDKKYSLAVADLSAVAEKRSEEPAGWFALAHAWYLAGQYSRAAVEYRKAILVEPTFVPAYTNLAWMLATCPDKKFRNGKMAVRYAKYACEMTGWKQYAILDTLAAAEAEMGNFHEAIKWQSAVVYLAPPEERAAFRERLELYGGLKPFHEEATEIAGITSATDTAGVLTRNDKPGAADFAKSLSLPLPDLEKLAAEKAEEEAKQTPTSEPSPSSEPTKTPNPTEQVTTDKPVQPEEDLSLDLPMTDIDPSEPGSSTPTPKAKAEEEPLPPDDKESVAILKKLGGRMSLHLTGQVQSLGLQYTKFTDQEAELLAGLESLEILDLTFTKIGEGTLKQLGKMKKLKLIVLDQTELSNDLLSHLSSLPDLEVLSVKATTISGPGLMHLKDLPKISMVLMNGTRVTSSELKQLQEAMPKTKFRR